MILKLKNNKIKKSICFSTTCLIIISCLIITVQRFHFNGFDWKIFDLCFRHVVTTGHGTPVSEFPQIKYVTITDDTYKYTGKNYLDRSFLTKVNEALTDLGTIAVAYDIIFPRPTIIADDLLFASSVSRHGALYLPIGLSLSDDIQPFEWENQDAYERLRTEYLKSPVQTGSAQPFYGTKALMQYDQFANAAFNSGHISAYADHDGVFRHIPMIIKIENDFIPALPLAMFLDYNQIGFDKIQVEWGKQIVIPALEGSYLEKPVTIPIDKKGLTLIPYHQTWESGFEDIQAHVLIEKMKDANIQGNLAEFFEGNFVFIGDISVGISDLGSTPLENNVPLLASQAAVLNGCLTNSFYSTWPVSSCLYLIIAIGVLLGGSALFYSLWPFYIATFTSISSLILLTWVEFIQFSVIPAGSLIAITIFIAAGLIVNIQFITQKDRNFIKSIFSTYVPDKIVDHLLQNPELLNLGGESREVTLMMTDIRGYTALSTQHTPQEVISILNRYFEKMFDIIISYDGIVNEIIGDGILVFFGAPKYDDEHAAKAVACAITMQNAMEQVNAENLSDGLPTIEMGVGINTGEVVVGNIGSAKRAQYGVTGSEVNLTARAESFTIGGQILVTGSVRDKLDSILNIEDTLTVGMKGIAQPVDLFDVTGLLDTYNLKLNKKKAPLVKLQTFLKADLFLMNSKQVSDKRIPISITDVSLTRAVIHTNEGIDVHENIRIHLNQQEQCLETAQVYAKVRSIDSIESGYSICVDFTSVAPEAKIILQSIMAG